jgi:hypothetical protein
MWRSGQRGAGGRQEKQHAADDSDAHGVSPAATVQVLTKMHDLFTSYPYGELNVISCDPGRQELWIGLRRNHPAGSTDPAERHARGACRTAWIGSGFVDA